MGGGGFALSEMLNTPLPLRGLIQTLEKKMRRNISLPREALPEYMTLFRAAVCFFCRELIVGVNIRPTVTTVLSK